MQSNNITKQNMTLEQRGIPIHSHFHVQFEDGSSITEHEVNWSDLASEQIVDHFGTKKMAVVCNHPIKAVTINHTGESITMVPNEGEQIYQAIRSSAVLQSDGQVISRVIGRVMGKVKDGIVLEEQYIGEDGQVWGMRR